jgi:threonine/homoserine/homoserine lactone efflux protein
MRSAVVLDPVSLFGFAIALTVAAATPGPAIAAIVARVLGHGSRGAAAFTAGIALGDVVWLSFAVLGLAALAQTLAWVFLALKYAGACYLLYLAWKLWTAPAVTFGDGPVPAADRPGRLFLGGLALTLGNPKTMLFYLALLPNLLDLRQVGPVGLLELAVVTLSVLAVVFFGYVVLAARARRLFGTPGAVRFLNRVTGTVMGGAAVKIAVS